MVSTYIGYSEELIIIFSLIFLIMKRKIRIGFSTKNTATVIFLGYYFVVTLMGLIAGNVENMSVVKFIIEFGLLLYCVSSALFFDTTDGIITLGDLRNLICISAIYGTIETIIKYNPLAKYVSIVNWLDAMNALVTRYQPSSFYLHYTYYAFFLLFGFIILLIFPYKNKLVNIGACILILEQLFFSKSRMGWITFAILILFYCIISYKGRIKKGYLYFFAFFLVMMIVVIFAKPELIKEFNASIIHRFSSFKIYGMLDGSLGQRWGTLLNYPKYLFKYPIKALIGTGYESISNSFLKEFSYFRGYNTVDNQYLSLLVESGIIGGILFLIAMIAYVKRCWNQNNNMGVFCKMIFILIAIQAITYGLLSYFQFTLIVVMFCLWGNNIISGKENQNER